MPGPIARFGPQSYLYEVVRNVLFAEVRQLASMDSVRFGPPARFAALPKDVKTVLIAGVLVIAGFLAALPLLSLAPEASGEAANSAVVGKSEGGRLLFGLNEVALGSVVTKGGAETIRWAGLLPMDGRADLVPDTTSPLASGQVGLDPLTDVRFTFRSAAYVKDGILHELVIPQDTLRLRVPGEPGHPGDTLVVTFDIGRSVSDEAGLLYFRPFVSEAHWIRAPTPQETAALDPQAGNKTTPSVLPQAFGYDTPRGTQGPAASSGQDMTQPDVGRAAFFVRDSPAALEELHAHFAKLGLSPAGSPAVATYYEGEKTVDLRAYDGPDDRAHLVSFQLPAGVYGALHMEFAEGSALMAGTHHPLTVPQPHLVLERNLTIEAGKTLTVLLDFSLDESLVLGGDGWEFRPVVMQYQTSDRDTDGDGVADPLDPDDDNDDIPDNKDVDRDGDGVPDVKPAQYRTGGGAMPSVGSTNSYYVQTATGRDPEGTSRHAEKSVLGDETRPIGSEDDTTATITNAKDLIQQPGTSVQTSNGQQLYILQALSRNLLPSEETLQVLGAREVNRLDNLPVALIAGPPGIAADLRALPGVTHVAEDVAVAPFP